jgi:hypothetical protein
LVCSKPLYDTFRQQEIHMPAIDLSAVSDADLGAEYARRARAQQLAEAQILTAQFTPEMISVMNDGHAYGLSGMAAVLDAQAPLINAELQGLRVATSTAARALRQLADAWQNQAAPAFTLLAQED